uniref:Uncharacterized protein n=1 Tax=Arcella intermedia TaxID=1963864 RepID=A0A6B2LEP7_9EUKA
MALNFAGAHMRDTAAQCLFNALKDNTSLTELDLSDNSISDTGFEGILRSLFFNTTLQSLRLLRNGITGCFGVSAGRHGLASLRELELSGNNIPNQGLGNLLGLLKNTTSLRKLHLAKLLIRDKEPVKSICEFLMQNSSLMELDLSSNYIGIRGIELITEALRDNYSLTKLNLSNVHLDYEKRYSKRVLESLCCNIALGGLKDNIISLSCLQPTFKEPIEEIVLILKFNGVPRDFYPGIIKTYIKLRKQKA